jgi:hypothetical protein
VREEKWNWEQCITADGKKQRSSDRRCVFCRCNGPAARERQQKMIGQETAGILGWRVFSLIESPHRPVAARLRGHPDNPAIHGWKKYNKNSTSASYILTAYDDRNAR